MKIERLRPVVRQAYQSNLELLKNSPEIYWREIEASIMMSRFFRYHVSGDIPDREYFMHMVDIALRNQHCQMLCFTKKYNIINEFLDSGKELPRNLHIIMSAWRGLKTENPYELPEAHVAYSDGTTTACEDAKKCGGNCSECAITNDGCWTLKNGEQVVFAEH
jgi:hypothetical protein